jgi:Predicted exporters of the RND superfamily
MKLEAFVIKFRWPIIVGFLAITVFMATQIPKAQIDADPKNNLPPTMASRVSTDKIESIFGNTDAILILLQTDDVLNPATLERIKKISKELNRLKGIDKVLSLFDSKRITGKDGAMIVEPAITQIPQDKTQREKLREDLKENKMVYKTVVSEDFTTAAIIGMVEARSNEKPIVLGIQNILKNNPGNEKVYLGGTPIIHNRIREDIGKDMINLMPVALLLMLVILIILFRQKRGALLPFGVVVMSIVFGMGLLPLIGWKITSITNLLPIMIIAIANNYAIYFINRYQELNTSGNTLTTKDIAEQVFRNLNKPVAMTGIVAIAGILGLLWHILVPAKQLGVLAASSIAFALLLSLFFIPAVLSILKKPKPIYKGGENKKSWIDKILPRCAKWVASHPKKILWGFAIVFVVCLSGMFLIKADANTVNFFPKGHPVRISSSMIDKYFGGMQNIALLIEGDIKDPELLRKLDYYQHEMEKMPEVGKTSSMATAIREMSKALNDKGEVGYDKIPDSRDAVAQYLELYSMSGDPKDFEKLVSFNYDKTRMVVSIKDNSGSALMKVVEKLKKLVAGDTNVKAIGGSALVSADIMNAIITGQVASLVFAVVTICILLIILFRSFAAGFIGALPIAFSIAMLFGVMGFSHIILDPPIAMLSSIVIGLGADFTIHFLWKYREERQNGLSYQEAVWETITTRGRGIVINAIAIIIGFSALFISIFPPLKMFGFLVVMSISGCLIGSLVFVPAICLVFKPKFLEPKLIKA